MFWAYRVLLKAADVERLGLWSLLMAGVSFARIVDVTGAGGLARFVAETRSQGRDAVTFVHTVTVTMLVLYAVLGSLAYLASDLMIVKLVEPRWVDEARELIPLAIVTGLFATPLASTLNSGIDGLQRADLRAILGIASYPLFMAIVLAGVPRFGLWAWAAALLVQQVFLIFGAWVILARYLPEMGLIPRRCSRDALTATLSYGLKMQANGVAAMLSDPLAKVMLSRFGGLDSVAIYELAARLVIGIRGLLFQMALPLVPEFASSICDRGRIEALLGRAARLAVIAAAGVLLANLLAAPLFSIVMLGEIRLDLIAMVAALALGYAVNVVSMPYYFAGVGCNAMRWNIGSQIVLATSVLLVGGLLGPILATKGIVIAVVIGLIGGTLMVIVGNKRELFKLPLAQPPAVIRS